MIHLALAFVWGLVGVILIAYHATTGDEKWRIDFLGHISSGWAALLICVYNFVRWWSYRSQLAAKKKAAWLSVGRTRRDLKTGQRPESVDPNPNFMFGDEPPPKP